MASIMASLSLPFFIDRPLIIHPANSWRSNCSDALSAELANAEYVEPEDESCHRKGDADKVTGQRPEASPVSPWFSDRTPQCSNWGNMPIPLALSVIESLNSIPRSGYLYALMIPSLTAHVRSRRHSLRCHVHVDTRAHTRSAFACARWSLAINQIPVR